MIGFKAELVDIKLNHRGLHKTLHSRNGPVARYIRAVGEQTVVLSKLFAGVKTAKLKRSIKMTRDRSTLNEYGVLVGSDVRHALVHHEGARRHVITPRTPGGVLTFRSKHGARVVTRRVNHPGHKANPYLVKALRAALRG